jgi:hypothetical protein
MPSDWKRKASGDAVGQSAALLLRPRRPGGLESTLGPVAGPLEAAGGTVADERERMDRLKDALAAARPAVPAGEQDALKTEILDAARSGLAKLYQGEGTESFTLGEHIGLESVILTDGTRPSLFIRDGFVDLGALDIGTWDQPLGNFRNVISEVISTVGKISVPVAPFFAGTCFVISEGYVVTNRHVLEAIATQDGAGVWTLRWPDKTTVDFIGEDGRAEITKFKVLDVAFAGPDKIAGTIDFSHLDMGVLRVDPASDAANTFPTSVSFAGDTAQPISGRDLYVVGFPGQPKTWSFGGTPPVGFETTQIVSTVFNDRFGVKRLAPGNVKRGAGQVANDGKSWICTHDASTLGGNSGSCVVDLSSDGFRIVGLHFAGTNREQNWAHVAGRLQDGLSNFSARFVS